MLIIQMMLSRCIFLVILAQSYHTSLNKWQHTSPIANTYSLAERIFNIVKGVVRSYKRNFSLPLKDQAIEYEDVISNGR